MWIKQGITELKQKICSFCGGKLRSLTADERKQITLKFCFPRGIYICDDCQELAVINITVVGDDMKEWVEIVEQLTQNDILSEKEAVTKAIEAAAVMPEGGPASVISIGRMFQCQGEGPSCQLYKLASCGLGDKKFCPDGSCNYDPYPEEYKKRFWYGMKSAWPEGNMDIIGHWTNVIKKSGTAGERADAVRRIGSITTDEVRDILLPIIFSQDALEVKRAALGALAKQKLTEEIKNAFRHALESENSPEGLPLLALKLIRDMRWVDVELAQKISYLITAVKGLERDAVITLRILEKAASTKKKIPFKKTRHAGENLSLPKTRTSLSQ